MKDTHVRLQVPGPKPRHPTSKPGIQSPQSGEDRGRLDFSEGPVPAAARDAVICFIRRGPERPCSIVHYRVRALPNDHRSLIS